MTDGKQSRDQGPFIEPHLIADRIKAKGVTVYSVGIGDIIDTEELKSIASDPEKVVLAKSFEALQDVVGNIRTLICKGISDRPPKGKFGEALPSHLLTAYENYMNVLLSAAVKVY